MILLFFLSIQLQMLYIKTNTKINKKLITSPQAVESVDLSELSAM